jgi:probable rRNA maturation factor
LSGSLSIRNRQRAIPVDVRELRRVVRSLLRDHFAVEEFDLGIQLVGAKEMTRLNETFLRHRGVTDVLAFDYGLGVPPSAGGKLLEVRARAGSENRLKAELPTFYGEIFICPDEAVRQARRFRTTWPSELVRYAVHGLLHLRGFDDRRAADRRKMKRVEDRLVKEIARRFPLGELARRRRRSARHD